MPTEAVLKQSQPIRDTRFGIGAQICRESGLRHVTAGKITHRPAIRRMCAGMKTKDDDPCLAHGIPLGQSSDMWKKRGTVTAGLASGRSSHNCAQAKVPPVSFCKVFYSAGDPTGGVVSPHPVLRVQRVMRWLTSGVRPTTT